ncbi:MAG TPA: ACP S-malonyltransferase [Burkholderiales bacterium]|nr:ACP S-malonyltransferase [Burkholderiales bacterium]
MTFAFVFPGQGSQAVGMTKAYEGLSEVREVFAEASDVLGLDILQMVQEGPAETLNQTINTQPVMLTAGYAVYRAWQAMSDKTPSIFAGHSLGEYSALVAAGALAFKDALPLVRFRAKAMQDAVKDGEGGMAAILGLDEEPVIEACREAAQGQVLEAVNLNSPGQIVIAGHREAVLRGCELVKAKGAKRAMMLPVSVPSHCALMKPAADKLRDYLAGVSMTSPLIPVVQNADVQAHGDAAAVKDALVRQLYSPVRWIETVQYFARQGIAMVVECGPGKVLGGLTKRIDSNLQSLTLHDEVALHDLMAKLQAA